MKRILFYIAAMLSCIWLLAACSSDSKDDPIPVPEPEPDPVVENNARSILVSQIETDVLQLTSNNTGLEAFYATSEAYAQLLALIERDKNFIPNMRTLFSAAAEKKSLLKLYPVEKGSELAKMGYIAYIIADNAGFGAQIVFDGKGGSCLSTSDHLEFIFPANVTGFGTTLFKLVIRNSEDCYKSVAVFNNLKKLACVNRMPRQITMTLTGLINDKELTLSENVIDLELPLKANSEYVNFDAWTFKLKGRQDAYLNSNDMSTLDYSLTMEGNNMVLGYGFTRNGSGIISCEANMALPAKSDFLSQMANKAFDFANLKSLSIKILDNLKVTGTISESETFAQSYTDAIAKRQQTSSADALAATVESLNKSCHLQLSCNQITEAEDLTFCVAEKNGKYMIEPALKNQGDDDVAAIVGLLNHEAKEAFEKLFKDSFTPTGNSAGSALKFYSTFMQMIPISGVTDKK